MALLSNEAFASISLDVSHGHVLIRELGASLSIEL